MDIVLKSILYTGMLLSLSGVEAFAQDNNQGNSFDFSLYGSWRMHANAAFVDEAAPGLGDSFIGISDAYSRVGVKADLNIGKTDFAAKLEMGVNTAELKLGDPFFFDDEDLRVKSVSATGQWGKIIVGKDWLPYYNVVCDSVDYFSSIYAGYSTYGFHRENQLSYTSPVIHGFQGSAARVKRTSGGPRGWQYAGSYTNGGVALGIGMEDMDNEVSDTYGATASYRKDGWYGAIKYEHNDVEGDIYNAFAQYTRGKFSYKAGMGLGDQYAGNNYHLAIDYHVKEYFKVFTEFYSEQNNYAILAEGAESSSDFLGAGGAGAKQQGKALVAGFRVDFDISPFH